MGTSSTAPAPPKEVIDLKAQPEAAVKPPTPAAANKPRVFKFQKVRFPGSPVRVGKERIQFRLVKQRTGGYAPYGLLETTDQALAEKLDKIAKAREQYVVRL